MEPSGSPRTGASPESTPVGAGPLNAVDSTGSLIASGTIEGNPDALINSEENAMRVHLAREEAGVLRRRILKFVGLGVILVICSSLIGWQLTHKKAVPGAQSDASVRYHNVNIPIANLDADSPALTVGSGQALSINGQLNVNNALVLAPTTRPDGAVTGQIYYDQVTNRLAYYNGSSFQTLLNGGDLVSTSLGGASGAIATGTGLAVSGQTLNNTGVLTLQGQTGNVTLAAGSGIVVNGTTLSNSGLLSLGGLNGDISIGTGLSTSGGALHNSGIISAVGAGSITVTNDGNGNITIDGPNGSGGGSGTVASPGGTIGKIAKFTGVQTIADSLLSDDGTTVTVGGALTVTGTVSLSTPLAVTSGGTGANSAAGARTALGAAKSGANSDITSLSGLTSALSVAQGGTGVGTLATNGVIIGNGTSALSSVVAGASGLCLVSNTGAAPTWSACPGSGGVSSVDGGTGALTLNNSSLTGSTISINDATTAAKGIASFNSTNFSVSAGAVNTIQNINTTAAPTFGQLVLTSTQATNPMLVINNTSLSASGALLDLQQNGSSRFSVTPGGNVSSAGTINGQTISNATSLTGSLSVGSTLAVTNGATVGGGLGVGGTLQVNTITPTSTLTIGAAGQSFTLQGNAASTFTSTSGGNTTTLGFQTPTANVTYNFPTAATGTYSVCTTVGNCAGVGGGVTSTGGIAGTIAKFTGSGTIANSIITDTGTTVTIGGALSVNTLTPSGALTIGATGQNLTLQGATVSLSATASGITNSLTFAGPSGSNKTITVPNASGTVAVSASGPLLLDASGNLTCPTCLSTGGSGGTTGVSSVNGLSGGLTLQGTSASSLTNSGTTITINDASSTVKGLASFNSTNLTVTSGSVNTVQDIAVTATPTFAGLNLTAALSVGNGGTGANTATNARTNLSAAKSGVNSDITSLTGLTTALSIAQGGTGVATTPTNGQILIGNGSGYSLNTLSAGTGVTINNTAGTITISAASAGTCVGCANTSLSNLSSVAINTSLLPGTAGGADLGSGTLPFGQLFLAGTSSSPAANNFKVTGAATGSRVITLPDASGTVAVSASGNIALSATGNLTFAGTLGVASGGTGANTLSSNGVLIGNGTGAITSVVAGSSGLCLTSVISSTPIWDVCPGSGSTGVTSLNGLTGALSIANATASGATVTINDASTSAKGIASFNSTNFSATNGAINTIQDINSTAAPTFGQLTLTSSQASNPMLVINNTNVSGSGNLIDLKLGGSSKLSVSPAGNLSNSGTISAGGDISTSGNLSGSTLNGQTISSTASFTGSVAVATGLTVGTTLQVNTITPTSSLTIGAAGQSFLLQGNASSTFTATNSGNTTTLGFQTPTANVTYNFPTATAGTYNICTTAGNCTGVGGGVTSVGGTNGKLAKFTGSGTIADSLVSESGSTVTVGGTLSVNTLTPSGALTIGATGQNLTLQGATVSLSATSGGFTNSLTFATPSGSGKTITLPNASGTVAVSASGPLALDASGNLTCPTCLSTGGSGGTAGVSSLNSLTGGLTLQGSSAGSITNGGTTITINDASSSVKGLASFNSTNLSVTSGAVNTVQDIAVTSTPTFGGLTLTTALTVANGGTGANTAANARTNLSAAKSGANSDITSLSGLTTALSVAQGGTGLATTPTNGQILIGNGSGYSLNTLSAGSGVTINNTSGNITISAASAGTCAGCATTSLNNLGSVAINTSLLPGSAGGADLGSGTLPFGQLFLSGTSASPASNNFKLTGAATAARTITLPDASGTVAVSASGNIALSATGNISFTGTLGVSSGGTGAATLGANGVLIGNGTSAVTSLVAGSGGLCLISVNAAAPTWGSCPGGGSVTTVGTFDSQTASANGAVISGTNIYLQSASATNPGLVNTSSQTFTGDKTFKSTSNSATAFQVQNASGTSLFTVDTSGTTISVQAATTVSANLTITNAGSLYLQKATDYSTTGSTNDVNLGTASLVRLTGASAQTITGISGGADGRVLTIINAGSNTATMSNSSASSSAANRILTGTATDLTLNPDASMTLVYDAGASRWRVAGAVAGSIAGGSYINNSSSQQAGATFNISGTGKAANFDATTGALGIGNSVATSITYGNTANTSSMTFQGSTAATYSIGTGTGTGTITLGQSTASNTIAIGDANTATGNTQTINIGNGTLAGTGKVAITIGNTANASSLSLQAGTGNLTMLTNSASASIIAKTGTNSATAFQIQNSSSAAILNADTTLGQTTFTATTDNPTIVVKRYASSSVGTPQIKFTDSAGTSTLAVININANGDEFFGGGNTAYTGTTGENTAVGGASLGSITTGAHNTALGVSAVNGVTTTGGNTGLGWGSFNTGTGTNNTAVGSQALFGIGTGDDNVGIGWAAGYLSQATTANFYNNVFIGPNSGSQDNDTFLTLGSIHNSVAIGYNANVQASDTIVIGQVENLAQVVIGSTLPTGTNSFGVSPMIYKTGLASQSGNTISGTSAPAWLSSGIKVGMRFIFADGTDAGTITAINGNTSLTVSTSQTVSSQHYRVHNTGFQVSNTGDAYVADTSTTAFQIQNASATSLLVADTTNSTIKVAGTTSTFAIFQIDNAHFKSTQTTAPTAGIATCTGSASVTSGSTDSTGSFTISPTSSAACVTTVTFNKAYGAAPKSVVVTAKNANGYTIQGFVSSTTTTTFVFTLGANATNGQAYQYYYWVVE